MNVWVMPRWCLQLFDWAGESPDDVEVGGFGGEFGGQRGVGGFAIESGAADAGAGQEMRDGLHGVLEFMVTERPRIARLAELAALRSVRGVRTV